eukprot:TRINITY_DN1051_c0_g1_i11.p1 TRINITY_DN1051_c0_g1~~TRINITY_DN1051_c0_g1_i11.p1  ORF type:complete len:609 (+),score=81.10 TRINITY_DN1051_c0_g1_i11:664-2490(+)
MQNVFFEYTCASLCQDTENFLLIKMMKNIIRARAFLSNARLLTRQFSSLAEIKAEPREQMKYDVLIVGGGPAGLSAAIRLKQLEAQHNLPISVCLIEKGSAIGSHILSGNVFQPSALDELYPDWRAMDNRPPLNTEVKKDKMLLLLDDHKYISIPYSLLPASIHNKGNYIISLGDFCKWMAERAQEMGVEIYTGFAGDEVLFNDNGGVRGVATGDMGISKKGEKKDSFARGVELIANQTIFAEGCRGSLSERIIKTFHLRAGKDPQIYGLGVKEVWEIKPENHFSGAVVHTVGWPLSHDVYGGSFMYHMDNNLVHFGLVVGLDYKNPYLNIYEEMQRLKTHRTIRGMLEGGTCISYGARALNEGGFFSIPKLTFPGGVLAGCGAGFLNVAKIKGTHNAMKSGMIAAESIYSRVNDSEKRAEGVEIKEYEEKMSKSSVFEELYKTRNFHGGFKLGLFPGLAHGFITSFVTQGREPWNLRTKATDSTQTLPKTQAEEIVYPKHDGKLTFDLLENLARSGTNHDHDQPSHLRIKKEHEQTPSISYEKYAAPEERFCPAKVYEFVKDEHGQPRLQINAQNCLHCKTCSIKMVDEYIDWNVPEGGGGPNYSGM